MLGVHRLEFGVKRLVEGIEIIEAVRNFEKTRGRFLAAGPRVPPSRASRFRS